MFDRVIKAFGWHARWSYRMTSQTELEICGWSVYVHIHVGAWGKLSHRQTSVAISILLDQLSVTGDTGRMSCNSGMACAITKQHEKNILIEFINWYREHPALWKVKFRQSLGSNLKSEIKFKCKFICRFKMQFLVHIDLLVTFFNAKVNPIATKLSSSMDNAS